MRNEEHHLDIRKLQRAIVDGLEDVKAHDIVVFNTEALSPLFERVIIASGNSNRQTKALASSVRETVKKRGLAVLRTEGEDNGEWIIVDCGAAVAHIMQPAIRDYYHLEEIWGAKPVRLKGAVDGRADRPLPKASEPMAVVAAKAAPKAASKAASKAVPKAVPKTAPKAGSAPAARKAAPRKGGQGKSVAGKSAAGKSAAGRSAAGRPAAAKPAKRAVAPRKAAPRKAPAQTAPRKSGGSGSRSR